MRPPHSAIFRTAAEPSSSAQFAHELANLLDGGMRHLNLAMSSLRDADGDDAVMQRLGTVNEAMRQMAMLVRQWMGRASSLEMLHTQARTLGQCVEQAVRLLSAAAGVHGITIETITTPQAAKLPAGPLYTVITNALRNAIEAIAVGGGGRIELYCRMEGADLLLTLRDDGPGLDSALLDDRGRIMFGMTTKTDGDGIGLTLSREIAADLGGTMSIRNTPQRGAEFSFRCPCTRLERS